MRVFDGTKSSRFAAYNEYFASFNIWIGYTYSLPFEFDLGEVVFLTQLS